MLNNFLKNDLILIPPAGSCKTHRKLQFLGVRNVGKLFVVEQ